MNIKYGGAVMRRILFCVVFCFFLSMTAFGDVLLVEKGISRIALVVPDTTDINISAGVEDLKTYFFKISGVHIPVIKSLLEKIPDTTIPIYVEKKYEDETTKTLLVKASVSSAGYVISVNAKRIILTGTTDEAVSFACADFLNRIGVRWYMPGEIGEVYPKTDTISIKEEDVVEVPDFETRGMRLERQWSRRNRLGGPPHYGGHGYAQIISANQYFSTNPEYFGLIKGKRAPSQLCVSNPEVVNVFVKSLKEMFRKNPNIGGSSVLGPNDGGGFCECDTCRAMDSGRIDPFNGSEPDIIDRQIKFMNTVISEVEKEFPGKKYGLYIYSVYQLPPLNVKPNSAIVPIFSPISFCRYHSMESPICPDRHSVKKIIEGWSVFGLGMWDRDYNFNLAGVQVPFHQLHKWINDIPYCKKNNFKGFDIESIAGWAISGPMYYMCSRLMWDAELDPYSVLDEYFTGFFGKSASPMKRYVMRMAEAIRDADYHTGADFDIPLIYTAGIVEQGDKDLQEAISLSQGDVVLEKRVKMFCMAQEYLKEFLKMRKLHDTFQFKSAKESLEKMKELIEQLGNLDNSAIDKKHSLSYIKRFWQGAVIESDSIVANGGEIVFKFPDEWSFLIDSNDIGEMMELYNPEIIGGNWQKIKTYSQSWADQGLFHYKGIAWYKNNFHVGQEQKGKRIKIWFGAVDEQAKVWVNGKLLGESIHNMWRPFEFDITDAIEYDKPNTVVLRVINRRLNEMGTGGITKIVMIYAKSDK